MFGLVPLHLGFSRARGLFIETVSSDSSDRATGRFSGASNQRHRPAQMRSPRSTALRLLFWQGQSPRGSAPNSPESPPSDSPVTSPDATATTDNDSGGKPQSEQHGEPSTALRVAHAITSLTRTDHLLQGMARLTPTFGATQRQSQLRHAVTLAVAAACTTANLLQQSEGGQCCEISPDEQDDLQRRLIALGDAATAAFDHMSDNRARVNAIAGSIASVEDAATGLLQQTRDYLERPAPLPETDTPPRSPTGATQWHAAFDECVDWMTCAHS